MKPAALLLVAACAETPGPRLTAVEPAAAVAGSTVTITGERLCGGDCATAGGAFRIGYDQPVQAVIVDYTDLTATVRIPTITPSGETVFIATVNDRASNALDFVVLAP